MENGWYDSTHGRSASSSRSRVVGDELEFESGAKVKLPPVNRECYVPPPAQASARGEDRYFQVDQPTEYRTINKYFEEKEDECGNVIEEPSRSRRDERLFIEKRHLSSVAVDAREGDELVQLPPVDRTCYKARSQSRNVSRPRRIESVPGIFECEDQRRPVNTFEQSARLQGYNYANNNISMIDINSQQPYTEVKRFSRASYRDIKKPRNLPRPSLERPPVSVSVGVIEQQQPAPVFTEIRPRSQQRQSQRSIANSKIGIEQIVQDVRPEPFVDEQQPSYFPSEAVQNNDIYWDQNQNKFVQEPWSQELAPQVSYRPPTAPRRELKQRETAPFEYVEPQQPAFTQEYQAKIFREQPARRSSRHRSPAATFVPQEPFIPVHSDSSQVNENLKNILPPVNANCFRPPSVQRGEDKFFEVNQPTEYNEVVEDVIVNDAQEFVVDQPQAPPSAQTNYGTSVIDEPRASSYPATPTEQVITQVPASRKIDIKTYFDSFGHEENAEQIIEESLKDVLPPVNCACARKPREELVTGDVKYFNIQEPTEYKNVREDVYDTEDNVVAVDCNQNPNRAVNQGFTSSKPFDRPPQQQQQQYNNNYEFKQSSARAPDNSYMFQARHYIDNQPVFEKMMMKNSSRKSEYYTPTHENAPKTNVRSMANDFIQNLDYHDYDQYKASGVQNLNKSRRAYGSQMNVNFTEPHHTVKSVSKDPSPPFQPPRAAKNYEKLITQVINDHESQRGGGASHYQSMRNLNDSSSAPLSYNQMKFQEFQANNGRYSGSKNSGQGYVDNGQVEIGRSVQNLPFASSNFYNAGPSRQYQPPSRRVPSQYQSPSQFSNPPQSLGRRVYHQSQFDLSNTANELQGPMQGFRSLRARRD